MNLICTSSKDDSFYVNKEYSIDNGYIYTEHDISINNKAYSSEEEAIEDLKQKGYVFKRKGIQFKSGSTGSFSNGAFDSAIFGDFSSFMESLSQDSSIKEKQNEAESLKNDMLERILRDYGL